MKRNHLLFLTHYFPPEVNAPANRTYEHARLWVGKMDVTVITNFPNHPDGKLFPGYKNRLIQKETIDGIDVVRLWTFITPNEGFVLRTLNYLIYMIASVTYIVFSGIKFDLLIATTPQFFCGLAGKYAARIRRKPFILELRDLWPESIIAVGAIRNRRIISFLENMELSLYRAADHIVCVTKSFKENLINRGIEEKKIDVVFNGVSSDIFSSGDNVDNQEIAGFLSDGFVAGYIGTIGMAHSIITLVKAAEKLKNENIKILVVGSGAERENLQKLIEEKGLKNIRIFPIQPKDQIPGIICRLGAFIIHLKNQPLFMTVIPSKLFEGMIMRKPLLLGVNGESRRIVEEAGCGLYFEPENEDDLCSKLLYYRDNPEARRLHGDNGYTYVLENYDRKKLAGKLLDIISEVIIKKSKRI